MKNRIVTLTMIFGLFITLTQAQDSGELVIPFSNPSSKGFLDVNIKRGSINVVGTDRKDVLVKYEAMVSKHKEKEKVKDGLKRVSNGALDLEAEESNNKIKLDSDSWNRGVNLTIEVPKNIDLKLDTYNGGDVYVENVNGEIILENYNGKITAKRISGSVSADTYNGGITVELLKYTSGTPMSFNTYNGNIDLSLPSDAKANLKLKTKRGEIYSGFEMEVIKSEPVKKTDNKSGTYKVYLDDWVKSAINGGGAEVIMKNYNGDIYIRNK